MPAFSFERQLGKAETLSTQPPNRACSREAEFRVALDGYIAHYAAEQRKRLLVVSRNNPEGQGWLQPLRRLLTASRQIGLFRTKARGRDPSSLSAPEGVASAQFEGSVMPKVA